MKWIKLCYDNEDFEKLKEIKESISKKLTWDGFVFASIMKLYKKKKKNNKNGKRKTKSKRSSNL